MVVFDEVDKVVGHAERASSVLAYVGHSSVEFQRETVVAEGGDTDFAGVVAHDFAQQQRTFALKSILDDATLVFLLDIGCFCDDDDVVGISYDRFLGLCRCGCMVGVQTLVDGVPQALACVDTASGVAGCGCSRLLVEADAEVVEEVEVVQGHVDMVASGYGRCDGDGVGSDADVYPSGAVYLRYGLVGLVGGFLVVDDVGRDVDVLRTLIVYECGARCFGYEAEQGLLKHFLPVFDFHFRTESEEDGLVELGVNDAQPSGGVDGRLHGNNLYE